MPSPKPRPESQARTVWRCGATGRQAFRDRVAREEPLEIQLVFGPRQDRSHQALALTMRSPGDDVHLALGLLFAEGFIGRRADVEAWKSAGAEGQGVVQVRLDPAVPVDRGRLERRFAATAACGLCGKARADQLLQWPLYPLRAGQPRVEVQTVLSLARRLRDAQDAFEHTGGMHAAALFDPAGKLLDLREDIGRHNAVDKLVGACWRQEQVPLSRHILMLSGRVGFELVQKAAMAGIPIVAGVGAASSLAVELAEEVGMTLIGFLRDDRLNCYADTDRLMG